MAQSGYTPILIYGSGTATNVPLAANLTSSASGTELALNYADGKLFYKDSGGVVQVLATKGAAQNSISFGTTGLTPNTATQGAVTVAGTLITSNGGTGLSSYTAGDLPYYASGTALSKLGIGTNGQILTSTGTAPQWTTLSGVAVTTFSAGTTGLTPSSATSGAITLAGTLNVANGGTGLNSLTAGYIPYGNGTSAFSSSSNLYFNGSYLGIGTSSPSYPLTVNGTTFTTGITISTGGGTNIANTVNIDTDGAGTARYYSHGSNTTTVGSHSWHLVSSNGSVDTTAMSLDSSGNVGIGTTSPSSYGFGALSVYKATAAGITIATGSSSYSTLAFAKGTAGTDSYDGFIQYFNASGAMIFATNGGTERMRIDSSGNLLVGQTSATGKFSVTGTGSNNIGTIAITNTDSTGTFVWGSQAYAANLISGGHHVHMIGTSGSINNAAYYGLKYSSSGSASNVMTFGLYGADDLMTLSPAGKLTMASSTNGLLGQIQAGVTSSTGASNGVIISTATNAGPYPYFSNGLNSSQGLFGFGYQASLVGSIFLSGTSGVTYNTTSDYRLKENVAPVTNGLSVINALNPVNFDWIKDKRSDTGFIAHEFASVIPNYVTGEKDAVDEKGNPKYQQMDNSGAVPYLVAAVKELNAIIVDLQAKLKSAGVAGF